VEKNTLTEPCSGLAAFVEWKLNQRSMHPNVCSYFVEGRFRHEDVSAGDGNTPSFRSLAAHENAAIKTPTTSVTV
jgi:hypothetical protein